MSGIFPCSAFIRKAIAKPDCDLSYAGRNQEKQYCHLALYVFQVK